MPWRHISQVPSPWQNGTITRSPGLKALTSGPTSSITPHISWPRTCGNSNVKPSQSQSPTQPCQSLRHTPFASTRTIAPWRGHAGSGTSRTTKGARTASITAARIAASVTHRARIELRSAPVRCKPGSSGLGVAAQEPRSSHPAQSLSHTPVAPAMAPAAGSGTAQADRARPYDRSGLDSSGIRRAGAWWRVPGRLGRRGSTRLRARNSGAAASLRPEHSAGSARPLAPASPTARPVRTIKARAQGGVLSHTSSMRTQRRSAIDFCTASIAWVILWPKAKSGSAGRPSASAQISSRASMIFWSL